MSSPLAPRPGPTPVGAFESIAVIDFGF